MWIWYDWIQNISYICVLYSMTKIKNKAIPQTNKNNKTKPENLMKKEYLESYDKLKKDIQKSQQAWRNVSPVSWKRILGLWLNDIDKWCLVWQWIELQVWWSQICIAAKQWWHVNCKVLNMSRVKNVPVFDEYGRMQGDKIVLTESISMGLAENNMQDKKPKERNVLS